MQEAIMSMNGSLVRLLTMAQGEEPCRAKQALQLVLACALGEMQHGNMQFEKYIVLVKVLKLLSVVTCQGSVTVYMSVQSRCDQCDPIYDCASLLINKTIHVRVTGTDTLSIRAASDAVTDRATATSCSDRNIQEFGRKGSPPGFQIPLLTCLSPQQGTKFRVGM